METIYATTLIGGPRDGQAYPARGRNYPQITFSDSRYSQVEWEGERAEVHAYCFEGLVGAALDARLRAIERST